MACAPAARAAARIAYCRRYVAAAGPGPSAIDSSACITCSEWRSASEYTATERISSRFRVRMMRHAISPRLAIRTLANIRVPDQNLERCWVVRIAGIVELRTIGDQDDDVHGGPHFHVLPRPAQAVREAQAALRSDRHVHEKIDVVGQIALGQSQMVVMRHGQEPAVAAGMHAALVERVAD